jgi:hypothetical protein
MLRVRIRANIDELFLPESGLLADLDRATSEWLEDGERKRLAREVRKAVQRNWRKFPHLKPFAGLPQGLDIATLQIGSFTRERLTSISLESLGNLDMATLFRSGLGPMSLLDALTAIEAVHVEEERPAHITTAAVPGPAHEADLGGDDISRRRRDPFAALPLDTLVGSPLARPGIWLADHWGDLTPDDLPRPAAEAALARERPSDVLVALLRADALHEGRQHLRQVLQARLGLSDRQAAIVLDRAGLGSHEKTLAEIGAEHNVTRERVRQLVLPTEVVAQAVRESDALPLSLQAWFVLNPGRPLSARRVREIATTPELERALHISLLALRLPYVPDRGGYWLARPDEARAFRAIANLDDLAADAIAGRAVARVESELPGVGRVLDVAHAVSELSVSPRLPAGEFSASPTLQTGVIGSLARKMLTYLIARAAPITPDELAGVIEAGHWPFESMNLTNVDPVFISDLAQSSTLLARSPEGELGPGGAYSEREPTGNLGVLYRTVRDAGAPVPTARLKQIASRSGMSENTTGVLVHGTRGPCLIPIGRGLVGMVGRDEHWTDGTVVPVDPTGNARVFLLPHGWAVRVDVDEDLLAGSNWEMPPPLADHLGLRRRRVIRLTDVRVVGPALLLEPKVHACNGLSLEAVLRNAEATAGDALFIVLRPPHYELQVVPSTDLGAEDPAVRLVANCGLPLTLARDHDLWARVGRVLGASAGTRDAVALRLRQRGQSDLLQLVEELGAPRAAERVDWPRGWEYTAPLDDDERHYAVRSANGRRIAIGVLPPGGIAPADAIVGDAGILWLDEVTLETTTSADPGRAWVSWARSEHWSRWTALAGSDWIVTVVEDGYDVAGSFQADLPSALDSVARELEAAGAGPASSPALAARSTYPRSALAFGQAERRARRSGLQTLRADSSCGFRAEYRDGRVLTGVTLVDALSVRE